MEKKPVKITKLPPVMRDESIKIDKPNPFNAYREMPQWVQANHWDNIVKTYENAN
jgi:hypothetical protein